MQLQHILAATDLSVRAGVAAQRAALLATQHDAALTVLHVVDTDTDDWSQQEARELVEEQVAALVPQPVIEVGTGRPFVEIIQRARALEAGLIVVGAGGQHSLRENVLGTTAERIARKGDRCVLAVRSIPEGSGYARVLVGVDFSEHAALAVRLAREAFPGAELSMVHVYTVVGEQRLRAANAGDDEIENLRAQMQAAAADECALWAEAHDLDADAVQLVAGRAGADLVAHATRQGTDVLVVGSRGRTGLSHVLLGSVAEHVLCDATCDVLVVRDRDLEGTFELP